MTFGADDARREPVVQSVNHIGLLIHNGVMEVSLDLTQQGGADLVSNVQFLFLCDAILLAVNNQLAHVTVT